VATVINIHAKFEVSSFTRSRYMEGSQNSKSRSRGLFTTPFDIILHFLIKYPVINLSVKFDADIFISDRYGYFTTSLIWLRNSYSHPFLGGFWGFDPLNVVGYCRDPQKAHPWPETRILAHSVE